MAKKRGTFGREEQHLRTSAGILKVHKKKTGKKLVITREGPFYSKKKKQIECPAGLG